ncbi:phosphohexomutase domain-containing protein [Desulfobulbus oligotrophicus]|uniref:Phosphomannomutase n=1 Tax=Desulfobulbus oligotrophicus TaxID=1909699 RepID=A0A7T5VBE7_9BACT|nr:phosphomannomutase [Desulfobulbus oligotrophicus]QQG64800.1 phosphomannomutase [Desulfobulbus oligotrophicus]
MKSLPACFTAYDVRGKIPDTFDEQIAQRIARAFVDYYQIRKVVVGRDMRLSSPLLAGTIVAGLLEQGVDVVDLGLCGTEEVYHAVFSRAEEGVAGGIMITASHNPAEYNGMKFVQRDARPVSVDSGLLEIARMATDPHRQEMVAAHRADKAGSYIQTTNKDAYLRHLLTSVDCRAMRPMKVVVNGGNGCAGPIIDLLAPHLPFTFIRLQHEPDGNFPNGVPNPLLPEKREVTAQAVREHRADLGIAWDGDFDRCFLYDENGRFIEGYYIVGLLAEMLLQHHPGSTILHDPRLVWNTREIVQHCGGNPVMTRTGHAFIKENMRLHNAVYGGEMSAHHYFRDFGYCDSGMLPWLLVCELMSTRATPLSALCDARMAAYPVSGEINSAVRDPDQVIAAIEKHYPNGVVDRTDGLSIEYPAFRFNVRRSNTEPLLRLNVETKGDEELLRQITADVLHIIRS